MRVIEKRCHVYNPYDRDTLNIVFFRYCTDDNEADPQGGGQGDVWTEVAHVAWEPYPSETGPKSLLSLEAGRLSWERIQPGQQVNPTLCLEGYDEAPLLIEQVQAIDYGLSRRVEALEKWRAEFAMYATMVVESMIHPQQEVEDVGSPNGASTTEDAGDRIE